MKYKELTMTKADLVKIISENTGIIRKDVAVVVDSLLKSVKDSLIEGNHIEIRGFGTFKLKTRKPRVGRNPKTDQKVPVPQRTVPTFKFSRDFKVSVVNVKTGK
jgi:DNA-binding protein HU-beta